MWRSSLELQCEAACALAAMVEGLHEQVSQLLATACGGVAVGLATMLLSDSPCVVESAAAAACQLFSNRLVMVTVTR